MKMVFVYPDVIEGSAWHGYYHPGIGVLAAVLRRAGHDVSLLHVTHSVTRASFLSRLQPLLPTTGPKLIGMPVTTNTLPFAREFAAWIKQIPDTVVILGGAHPTINAESTIALPNVDIVCQGEGEGPLVDLCARLSSGSDYSDVPNLWVKKNGTTVQNPMRPLISNLDDLPFPARDLFDFANLHNEQRGSATMMLSRGCPYQCAYCCNEELRSIYHDLGRYVRFPSVSHAIAELKHVKASYPWVKGFVYDDDILPMNKRWFDEFASAYAEEVGLPFTCNIRPNLLTDEVVELLYRAGCQEVRMGVESGNERIRNDVLNRHLSEEKLVAAARTARKRGIRLYSLNMVGVPGEKMPEMLDTVKMNARLVSDYQRVTIFFPFEQTPLWYVSRDQNLLTGREVTDFAQDTSLRYPRGLRNQIVFVRHYFAVLVKLYRLAYGLPKSARPAAVSAIDVTLGSRVLAHTLFPAATGLYGFALSHPGVENFVRKIKHRLLGSSWLF